MFKYKTHTTDQGEGEKGHYEHYTFKFKNNYGASVIRRDGSHGYGLGLYELMPIYWNDENYSHNSEPIGNLTVEEVNNKLDEIKEKII